MADGLVACQATWSCWPVTKTLCKTLTKHSDGIELLTEGELHTIYEVGTWFIDLSLAPTKTSVYIKITEKY